MSALSSEPSAVGSGVIVLVAGEALTLRVTEALREVACLAWRRGVKSEQRQPCQVVIELDPSAPAALVVTTLAASVVLGGMNVVRPVAGETGRGEFILVNISLVAVHASDAAMGASQSILRLSGVVE